MAPKTDIELQKQVIYSVYVRAHTEEGSFLSIIPDLDRIRALGTDIIWFMPIHPIGEKGKKGSLGCPYANRDYRTVNPQYGTEADFRRLVDEIHKRGMKCMIDVVYNHTSPDSWLAQHHPEWFYHKPDGSFGNRVGDWTDIIDLDYSHKELWQYQIDTLKMWAGIVDGFRCDVAPLVPLSFWLEARRQVEQVRPGCIWLAESVEPHFVIYNRRQGIDAHSDSELYQAFDICYDYDIFDVYRAYLTGKRTLAEYAEAVNRQEGMYPGNYVKLRYLENHDRPRAAQTIADARMLANWTAFLYFQKGMTLLFNGQELGETHLPRLFEKDPVQWKPEGELAALMRKLYHIKKDPIFTDSVYSVQALPRDILLAVHEQGEQKMVGIFSVAGNASLVEVPLPDGTYENLLGGTAEVHDGRVSVCGAPILLRA